MKFVFIILWVSIILLLYILYHVTKYNSAIVVQNYLKNGISSINMSALSNYNSDTYAYEIWININTLNSMNAYSTSNIAIANTNGNIFYITNCISLDVYNNGSLYVNIYDGSNSYKNYKVTSSLDLQSWQQIIISVNKNNILDLYLNGKLISSINTNTTIPVPTSSATIHFGRADAFIAKFNRLNKTMTTNEAWKLYLEGNAGVIPVHAGVSLLKNSYVTSNYTFF